MIDTVTIAGQQVDPCHVLANVTVLHGRGGVADGPTASSATIVVDAPPGPMPVWAAPDLIVLSGPDGPLFTGRIATIDLDHPTRDGQTVGAFTITATGPVARLGLRPAGDVPWPQEAGTARATHILDAAAVPYLIDGAADQQVLPREVDSRPALDLLGELAESTSAAVFDLPDGRVVYQPMADRASRVFPWRWQDFQPEFRWQDFAPALTWADMGTGEWWSPASQFPVDLPCQAVAWEPRWSTTDAAIVNHARIGYGLPAVEGDEQPWEEAVDQGSVDTNGRRYLYRGTQLAVGSDAQALATRLVTVYGRPHWSLPEVTVILDHVDEAVRGQVVALVCGDHVTVTGMPAPAPATDWTGIVEGWTYTQWAAAGRHQAQMVFAVSALPESLAVMRWAEYPPGYRWADHPAWITWADLISVDDLEAT